MAEITTAQARDFLREYAESVDVTGYLIQESDIETIVNGLLEGHKVDGTGFMIDAQGRLWLDATHVGWLRKECGRETLNTLADKLGAQLPGLLDDFKTLKEGNGK